LPRKMLIRYRAGGIKMSSADTRIKINNTLDERLKILEDRVSFPERVLIEHEADHWLDAP
jgi:hypothetical protein